MEREERRDTCQTCSAVFLSTSNILAPVCNNLLHISIVCCTFASHSAVYDPSMNLACVEERGKRRVWRRRRRGKESRREGERERR